MTLQQFVDTYTDKTIDFDGAYGGQCVDLYRQYCKEVLNIPQSPGVTGAKDIWNSYLSNYFDRIPNTPDGIPQPGDIMIWSDKYGPFGHVAIVLQATLTTFTCFSQNDPTGAKCIRKTYRTYAPTLGWLHPKEVTYKGIDLTNQDSVKVCIDIWKDVIDGNYVKKDVIEGYAKTISELQDGLQEWKKEYEEEKSKAQGFKDERDNLWKVIAGHTPPDVRQEIPDLVAYLEKVTKYEDTITQIKKQYDGEKSVIQAELDKLKRENEILRNAVDRNLEQIKVLSDKVEALQSTENKPLDSLITWILNKLKGGV